MTEVNEMFTINMELRGLTYHIVSAFVDRMEEIKKYAEEVITVSMNKLRKEGLQKKIIESVEKVMTEAIDKGIAEAIEDSINKYFSEGEGKEFIIDAIQEYIDKKKK